MKKVLSLAELDAQTAVELPDRELLAVVNIGGGLINVQTGNITVDVDIRDVNVGANVCVAALGVDKQVCEVTQN
jgi:hypothetical protein